MKEFPWKASKNAILTTVSSNVKENRMDKVLQDLTTTVPGRSNCTYVSRLDHKHGCCNNFVNWLLFDHHTWIVRVIPISLVDVTVTDHSANVSGVIVIMATHVIMPFCVTKNHAKSEIVN